MSLRAERPQLTGEQRDAVSWLIARKRIVAESESELVAARRQLERSVKRALAANLTPAYVAGVLGVTRQRVEQMRDA